MSEEPTQSFPDDAASLAQVVTELRALSTTVRGLEEKIDARSRETRPMSERIDQIVGDVAATRQELREVKRELREVNRTLHRMNVDFAVVVRNQDEMEDRISALEGRES